MTLLVGILARDGVVVAADSAVTFGAVNMPTISDSDRKIEILDARVIVVGTGQVGLGQRFTAQLRAAWAAKELADKDAVSIGRQLSERAFRDFGATGAPKNSYGALVAVGNSRGAHLVEFAVADFQPQAYTQAVPYVSMGSGQILADPYLALLRRSVWTAGAPTVADATFAAYWVMHQAIEAAPGGIAGPIDIAVIRKKSGRDYEAVLLGEAEIEEHKNRAKEANDQLALALRGESAQPIPLPPAVPLLVAPTLPSDGTNP